MTDTDAAGFAELRGSWDYGTLPANVRLGRGCFIERKNSFERFRSTRDPGMVLGDRVRICTWTAFSIDPGGLVEIGDDTLLVGAVFMGAEHIRVGRNVVISYNVTIADSDFHPIDPELRRRDAEALIPGGSTLPRPPVITSPVVIDDDVWIGIGAIVLKGVHIGRGARIGAGAIVTRDVPARSVVEPESAGVMGREPTT